MRVISGTARGRRLREPAGYDIRPTGDMIKESVFNIIQFDIEGRRVLDLFAGTGQLGIEALSRGAKSAVFIDSRPESVKLIWENLRICGLTDAATVLARDALRYLETGSRILAEIVAAGEGGSGKEETGSINETGCEKPVGSARFDLIFIDPPYNSSLAAEAIQKIIKFDKLDTNGIMMCETGAGCEMPVVSPPYYLEKEYRYGSVKISRYTRVN